MKMRKPKATLETTQSQKSRRRSRFYKSNRFRITRPGVGFRLVTAFVLACLITISVPAAPETLARGSEKAWESLRFAYLSGDYQGRVAGWFVALFVNRKKGERRQTVEAIRIVPEITEVAAGQEVVFSAIATDRNGETVSGLKFEWSSFDEGRGRASRIVRDGKFRAPRTGTFSVRATANGVTGERQLTVTEPAPRPRIERKRVISSRSGVISESIIEPEPGEDPQAQRRKGGPSAEAIVPEAPVSENWDDTNWLSADDPGNLPGNPPGSPVDDGAGNGNFQIEAPVISLPGRGLDVVLNLNYNSRVWNKAGSQLTFDIDRGMPNAPGWTLGFGKMVNMGSSGGCMLIGADGTRHGYSGDLSPFYQGFNFTGHTADGKFIDYGCTVYNTYWDNGWAQLPNGTTVQYSSLGSGTANTHMFPVQVTDAHGNYINITYRNPSNPQIDTVTDTLGRVITFHYDSLDRLIYIKAPRMTDQGSQYGTDTTRILVRIHYRQLTLGYSFAGGITAEIPTSTPWVIDSIFYPATGNGYWFGGADTNAPGFGSFYSSYGMLAKVEEHRGMSWSTGTETQGTINPGTATRTSEYNYPLTTANASPRTNGVGLSDAPTYTELKESWDGMDVTGPAVTTYAFNNNDWKNDGTTLSPARSVTVNQPNGIVSRQYSYRTPGTWTDGLVFYDETEVMNGSTPAIVSSSLVSWQQGNYDSPRPTWAEVTDENGDKVKTTYEYSTNKFNQITKSCDYDDGNTKLRCAVSQYENATSYIGNFNTGGQFTSGRHIFNLIKAQGVENPDGSRASWTEFEYDNATLQDAPEVIQHLHTHNPHTLQTQPGPSCLMWQPKDRDCSYEGQEVWVYGDLHYCACEQYEELSVYDPATDKRGNLTKITSYTDAATLSGQIIETRAYDITGNLMKVSGSGCCEETTFLYDDPSTTSTYENYYAYPLFQTRGSSNPSSQHRLTTSSVYSFETGLVKETTDAAGLTSESWYDPDSLRPARSVAPTGAYTVFSYNDPNMTVTEEVFEITTSGPLTAGKTMKYLNGLGQVRIEESYGPGGAVDIVATKYTLFGEEWMQSRPYRSGDPAYWSEKVYDNQRRIVKIVERDSAFAATGTETKAFYNESGAPSSTTNAPGNKIRVMDAWGRERWSRYDQQGRLVEVVEPNPDASSNSTGSLSASGNLLTKYTYDTLGRLVQTDQGSQVRKFKYDSLGRVTRQKLAEQTATLKENGTLAGAGHSEAVWGEAFIYDSRSNLTQKTDARGVRTVYSYNLPAGGGLDPLNRIHERSYDTSGPLQTGVTVAPAPTVTYEYMTSGDVSRTLKIRTAGVLTEDYSYDSQSRVNEYEQTLDSHPSSPLTVNYVYDTLDRVKEAQYPEQYQFSGGSRKIVKHTFDTAGRLATLGYGTSVTQSPHASEIKYNAADQTTELKIGSTGSSQVTERFTFDAQTGFLTNQKAIRNGTELMNLSYEYGRGGSVGSLSGKTGHLTKITDNLDTNKNREYEFDALGRLTKAKGGTTGNLWNQQYTYDRYGNRTNVTKSGNAADGNPIILDGTPSLSYDNNTNRITTTGHEYDVAGNMTLSFAEDGVTALRYGYDAANRLVTIRKNDVGQTLVNTYKYGSTNARLSDSDAKNGIDTVYCSAGGTVVAEFLDIGGNLEWSKSHTYLGDTQVATIAPGSGSEQVEFNHPDRLGTRLKTNPSTGASAEQAHLPFGTALDAESTLLGNNKRFTSYDRSVSTGLDYALNRAYESRLGRFTQSDPIGMNSVDLMNPQTLNLYAYSANDPINHVDPDGLFLGKLFKAIWKFFKKALKWIVVAISVAVAVLTIAFAPILFPTTIKLILGLVAAVANAVSSVLGAFGLDKASAFFGMIASFASFGTSLLNAGGGGVLKAKNIISAIAAGATATGKALTYYGHKRLGQIFNLAGTALGFVASGLKADRDASGKATGLKWDSSYWQIYKFARSSAEQIAEISGKSRLAGYINALGVVDDTGDIIDGFRKLFENNVAGGDEVYRLDPLKNQRRLLTGAAEFNARWNLLVLNLVSRSGSIVGKIRSIGTRTEKYVTLVR